MNPLWITVNLEFGSTCTGRWGVEVILVIFQLIVQISTFETMSVYIMYCLSKSIYADLEPIPDAIVVKQIANAT